MSILPDGTYSIELPLDPFFITDMGDRPVSLLRQGVMGKEAHKVCEDNIE